MKSKPLHASYFVDKKQQLNKMPPINVKNVIMVCIETITY